jgi:hypothetical protein
VPIAVRRSGIGGSEHVPIWPPSRRGRRPPHGARPEYARRSKLSQRAKRAGEAKVLLDSSWNWQLTLPVCVAKFPIAARHLCEDDVMFSHIRLVPALYRTTGGVVAALVLAACSGGSAAPESSSAPLPTVPEPSTTAVASTVVSTVAPSTIASTVVPTTAVPARPSSRFTGLNVDDAQVIDEIAPLIDSYVDRLWITPGSQNPFWYSWETAWAPVAASVVQDVLVAGPANVWYHGEPSPAQGLDLRGAMWVLSANSMFTTEEGEDGFWQLVNDKGFTFRAVNVAAYLGSESLVDVPVVERQQGTPIRVLWPLVTEVKMEYDGLDTAVWRHFVIEVERDVDGSWKLFREQDWDSSLTMWVPVDESDPYIVDGKVVTALPMERTR